MYKQLCVHTMVAAGMHLAGSRGVGGWVVQMQPFTNIPNSYKFRFYQLPWVGGWLRCNLCVNISPTFLQMQILPMQVVFVFVFVFVKTESLSTNTLTEDTFRECKSLSLVFISLFGNRSKSVLLGRRAAFRG